MLAGPPMLTHTQLKSFDPCSRVYGSISERQLAPFLARVSSRTRHAPKQTSSDDYSSATFNVFDQTKARMWNTPANPQLRKGFLPNPQLAGQLPENLPQI